MKVLITNTVALNGGVAAMVLATRDVLLRTFGPETEVLVYDSRPETAERLHPSLRFRKLLHRRLSRAGRVPLLRSVVRGLGLLRFRWAARLRRSGRPRLARLLLTREEAFDLEQYATADLVVSTGGTYLVENYDLSERFFDFEITLALGRPLVFFTQSMGPFRKPRTREAVARYLEAARLVLLRDEASVRHVREIGVRNPEVRVCGDSVFALEAPPPAAAADGAPTGGEPLRVAVSVRHWPFFRSAGEREGMESYRRAVAAAVAHLVRAHGARVTFVSTCQGVPEYAYDDSATALEIAAGLPQDVRSRVEVDRAFRDPAAVISALRGFDLVVATRFHAAVLALVADVPTVAVAYEFMTRELYVRMGLEDWVQDIDSIDPTAFCARIDRCLAEADSVRPRIRAAVARESELAWSAAGHLARVCGAPRQDPLLVAGAR